MRSNSEEKLKKPENSKELSYYQQYSKGAYQFFSSWVYSSFTKLNQLISMPELKSPDPLLGQAPVVCRSDGTGIHHLIANAAELALSKPEYAGACYWYFGPENTKYSRFSMLMIDPKDIEWLFKSKVIDTFDSVGSFSKVFGENNIFSLKLGTKEWRDERNRHLQVLDDKVIGKDLPTMRNIWDDFVKTMDFPDGKAKISNLEKFTSDFTLDVVAKTKLGITDLPQETKNEISSIISKISVKLADQTDAFLKMFFPFADYFPFYYFFNQEFNNIMKMGHELLKHQVIKPNQQSILAKENFITLGREKKSINLNSADIINQFKEFLVVGHETTAKLLLFTIMLLADDKNIEILERLRAEIRAFKNGDPRDFAKEDFDHMIFLNAILHEVLRLYPP
ncbi:MAG TPA: cytochrome P450, partial [Gammaproteobacteria bacterium]|nr:cytochrome P450 [Gammaproteobacteria bacterium]